MKYDFTSIMDRKGRDAIAVDMIGQPGGFAPEAPAPGFDVIPMWVADMDFPSPPAVQEAILRYQVKSKTEDMSKVQIQLLTGRTHQIRAHKAYIGHPLVGDGKYGINRFCYSRRKSP